MEGETQKLNSFTEQYVGDGNPVATFMTIQSIVTIP